MTSYYGLDEITSSAPEGMSRHAAYKEVSLELADVWHHYVPMNSTTETNVSGRHHFELHPSGAIKVFLTVFKPTGLGQRVDRDTTLVRIYGPGSYVTVEGQEATALAPTWRD